MRILSPKYVKKANSWVVTTFKAASKGEDQEEKWFSTLEEAQNYISSLTNSAEVQK